jgi:hypothetical protein
MENTIMIMAYLGKVVSDAPKIGEINSFQFGLKYHHSHFLS